MHILYACCVLPTLGTAVRVEPMTRRCKTSCYPTDRCKTSHVFLRAGAKVMLYDCSHKSFLYMVLNTRYFFQFHQHEFGIFLFNPTTYLVSHRDAPPSGVDGTVRPLPWRPRGSPDRPPTAQTVRSNIRSMCGLTCPTLCRALQLLGSMLVMEGGTTNKEGRIAKHSVPPSKVVVRPQRDGLGGAAGTGPRARCHTIADMCA